MVSFDNRFANKINNFYNTAPQKLTGTGRPKA
jgi:hypothetical protein